MPVNTKFSRDGFGSRLRQLRKQNGWTLSQVSKKSGLATSTLSKVENNQTSLTYDNLLKLANGIDVNISELLTSDNIPVRSGRRTITRLGEAKRQITKNYDYQYHSSDLLGAHMIPIVVEVKARSIEEFGEMLRHGGEEFIYVVKGTIEVHTEFYGPVTLNEGESIYLDSTMGHAYVSVGDGAAQILGICSGTAPESLRSAVMSTG